MTMGAGSRHRMFRRLLRKLERSEGQAMLEFVLVLPLIVTLVFVLIQMGLTFNSYLRVTDAARVAARAAAVARFNGQQPCVAAQAAVPPISRARSAAPSRRAQRPGARCR